MTLISSLTETTEPGATDADPQDVRALARILVFARQNAIDLKLETAVHCLDLALRCILQDGETKVDGLDFRDLDLGKRVAH